MAAGDTASRPRTRGPAPTTAMVPATSAAPKTSGSTRRATDGPAHACPRTRAMVSTVVDQRGERARASTASARRRARSAGSVIHCSRAEARAPASSALTRTAPPPATDSGMPPTARRDDRQAATRARRRSPCRSSRHGTARRAAPRPIGRRELRLAEHPGHAARATASRAAASRDPAGEGRVGVARAGDRARPVQRAQTAERVEQDVLPLVRRDRPDAEQPASRRRAAGGPSAAPGSATVTRSPPHDPAAHEFGCRPVARRDDPVAWPSARRSAVDRDADRRRGTPRSACARARRPAPSRPPARWPRVPTRRPARRRAPCRRRAPRRARPRTACAIGHLAGRDAPALARSARRARGGRRRCRR